MGHHQPCSPSFNIRENIKQGPNPLLVSGHSPKTLQLPSIQPTMAWVLARHGFDDISGAHVINHHTEMTVHHNNGLQRTHYQHHLHLPIQHTPLSWVDWRKISPTMRQHSSKQMYTKLLLCHNKSKTLSHIEFIPLASPAESSKIRTTCAARLSNVFHLFSNTNPEQRR